MALRSANPILATPRGAVGCFARPRTANY